MSQINQKEAVIKAVKEVLGTQYNTSIEINSILTKSQKSQIIDKIFYGIISGHIAYNKDNTDTVAVKKYAPGVISNYLRKAKELNGGKKYVAQSVGRGSRDPKLSQLLKLQSEYNVDTQEYKEVATAIIERRAELTTTKVKVKKQLIDTSILPDDLQDLATQL
jgi:hypothetical protein